MKPEHAILHPDIGHRRLLSTMVGLYGILLLIFVLAISVVSIYSYGKMIDSLSNAARNSLLISDYRQAIQILNPMVGPAFKSIRFVNDQKSQIFVLGDVVETSSNRLGRSVSVPITSSPTAGQSGWLEYSYSLERPVGYSVAVWLIALLSFIPILRRSRMQLEKKWLAEVERQQIETQYLIAQQVSHDIRSPLTALNMVVTSLDSIPLDKKAIIIKATDRIKEIANDLLTKHARASSQMRQSGRALAGSVKPHGGDSYSAAQLLKDIFAEKVASLGPETSSMLKLDIDESTDSSIFADTKELARAFSNLINNALEAIEYPEQGTVTIAVRSALKDVAVIISDNGKGIPEEVLVRLGTERFSYGKTGAESGSGLGVLHAKQTVESLGGKFHIQSRVGVGTMVTMRFPRALGRPSGTSQAAIGKA